MEINPIQPVHGDFERNIPQSSPDATQHLLNQREMGEGSYHLKYLQE